MDLHLLVGDSILETGLNCQIKTILIDMRRSLDAHSWRWILKGEKKACFFFFFFKGTTLKIICTVAAAAVSRYSEGVSSELLDQLEPV